MKNCLTAAEQGRLQDRAEVARQVRRMLADPRSSALVANFGGQWLYLRNVRGHAPDPDLFPEFDDNLREAFSRETEMFFDSQLRDDRSVVDLLRANYTFVNERLARHYGIPGVYGSHFRRVTLPDDRRAGLLGQGSILTVTSYAHRTSPVVRGKWLLENLLGAPPPPPPPNIPALKENNEGAAPTSVRERLEEHRKNPVCASCHARMDPLGFALENFDAIGRWRSEDESGKAVDASGVLPDGTQLPRAGRVPSGAARAAGRARRQPHREAPDLRARPRARVVRHAGRARHCARRGAGRLPVVVDYRGHRRQRAVPDAGHSRAAPSAPSRHASGGAQQP